MVKPPARTQRGQHSALSHNLSNTAASLVWHTVQPSGKAGSRCLLVGMLCVVTELWPLWWKPSS